MDPFPPWVDSGQSDNSSSVICFGVLGVRNHVVSSTVLCGHVLVAIGSPVHLVYVCRSKVGRAWVRLQSTIKMDTDTSHFVLGKTVLNDESRILKS